jgi:hypothetical protein
MTHSDDGTGWPSGGSLIAGALAIYWLSKFDYGWMVAFLVAMVFSGHYGLLS